MYIQIRVSAAHRLVCFKDNTYIDNLKSLLLCQLRNDFPNYGTIICFKIKELKPEIIVCITIAPSSGFVSIVILRMMKICFLVNIVEA